jgi:hypothetical protein
VLTNLDDVSDVVLTNLEFIVLNTYHIPHYFCLGRYILLVVDECNMPQVITFLVDFV